MSDAELRKSRETRDQLKALSKKDEDLQTNSFRTDNIQKDKQTLAFLELLTEQKSIVNLSKYALICFFAIR